MTENTEERQENWLRVVWGLLYVRDGLHCYVDGQGKQQYQTFINNVNPKCNTQICDQCQVNNKCQSGRTKVTGKSPFRPGHFCDEMNKEIQNNHIRNNPIWVNTDSTKWQDPHVGYWEVSKCYLSTPGYLDKIGPNQVDASGLLSICINSSFIKQNLSGIHNFIKVRDIRNNTLHDALYELDSQIADTCLDTMISVLEDTQELVHDAFAKRAAGHIKKIKARTEKTPAIMNESLLKWLQTNIDVEQALKEIEGQMYERLRKELRKELKEFIVEEVRREVKHSLDNRRDDKAERDVKGLKTKLVEFILDNYSTLPLNPILQHQDSMLVDFYEPPKMTKAVLEKNTNGIVQKPIAKIEDLFINECRDDHRSSYINRVYISGEAGMGKTSFTQYLALAWCAVHGESEECVSMREKMKGFKQFNDIDYLQQKDLLFLFHLRQFENEYECKRMLSTFLHTELGYSDCDVNELFSYINSPKTVLLMDGLDEWKCSETTMPKYSSLSKVNIVCTSRPWKIDSCVTAKMQDHNKAAIMGIAFDFVTRLVRNVTDCLRHEGIAVRDNTDDFMQTLHSKELRTIISHDMSVSDELLMIPVLILQLLCLWHDGKDFGNTRTQVYINMVETLLYRMKKKQSLAYCPKKSMLHNNIIPLHLLDRLKAYCCIEESENMAKISRLAFELLFTRSAEHSLQFRESDLDNTIQQLFMDMKKFGLDSGIIRGTSRKSSSSKDELYSFIHKSYQEFFAALHIVKQSCSETIRQPLLNNIKSLDDVIELANIFDFVCAFGTQCIEPMVSLVDYLTSTCAMKTNDDTHISKIFTIQTMILTGCYKYEKNETLPIKLSNLIAPLYLFGKTDLTEIICKPKEIKIKMDNCNVIINKTVSVLSLHHYYLDGPLDLSRFLIQELILKRVEAKSIIVNKVQHLKRLTLDSLRPNTITIPFQFANHLTYLSLSWVTIAGPLDLSQCPLQELEMSDVNFKSDILKRRINVVLRKCSYIIMRSVSLPCSLDLSQCQLKKLELWEVETERVIFGSVETCTLYNVSCPFDFTLLCANKLTHLSMQKCSLSGPLDLSQCQLKKLVLREIKTERVSVGCVVKCTLNRVYCTIDFTGANKLTDLSMKECSLTGLVDLSQCPLSELGLKEVNTERMIVDCVELEKCTLYKVSCSFDFTRAHKLNYLSMEECSLSGPLDLSQCPLKELELWELQTEKMIVGCVEKCTLFGVSCPFDFTRAHKLNYISMEECSLSGPLDLSHCPLKELELEEVKTERVIVIIDYVERCTLCRVPCSFDFTRANKLTYLRTKECSLSGPLDLSQCPLKELQLWKVETERVIVGRVETCTLCNMSCSFDLTRANKLTHLRMQECSISGPLDLSQCPLKELELEEVKTERVIVGRIELEKCTLYQMSCSFDFTSAIKLTYLCMKECSQPGPHDLSLLPLKELELRKVETERVIFGCVETCTLYCMSCSFDLTRANMLTYLTMEECSLSGPLDLSQCPLKELHLKGVKTEKVVVNCLEKCTLYRVSFSFDLTLANKLTYLNMKECSISSPLDLSQCPLKKLKLEEVKTERVIVGCVEKCSVKATNCLFDITDANKLIDLSFIDCSLTRPVDLSSCPIQSLQLIKVNISMFTLGSLEALTKLSISDYRLLSLPPPSVLHVLNMKSSIDLSNTSIEHLILHNPDVSPSLFKKHMTHLYSLPRQVTCTVKGGPFGETSVDQRMRLRFEELIEGITTDKRFTVKTSGKKEAITYTVVTSKITTLLQPI